MKTIDKMWGKEEWIVNNEESNYCGKILTVFPNENFSMHFHDEKVETFYVLSGTGICRFLNLENSETSEASLFTGQIINIPRLLPHQIKNTSETENLVIVEFSTFHRDEDSFRVFRKW